MTSAGESFSLNDKAALITGGGSGVGLQCAKLLIDAGASVLLVGRDSHKLRDACGELGSDALYFAGDVTSSKTADDAVHYGNVQFDRPLEILINNAGVILRADAVDTADEDWQRVMDVNINGVFYFSRAFAQQQIAQGAVVNVSSTCGQIGDAGLAAYCASKGAVDQLTRSMALELAPRKITVNAVAPGAINSPMLFSQLLEGDDDHSVVVRNRQSIPIGEIAEPQEVARSILFLLGEPHITGTILSVDGGYTAQ